MFTSEILEEKESSELSKFQKHLDELQDEIEKQTRPFSVLKEDILDKWVNSLKKQWKLGKKEMKYLQDSLVKIVNNYKNFLVETESVQKYYIDSNKLISWINENLSNQQKRVIIKVLKASNTERWKWFALQIVRK